MSKIWLVRHGSHDLLGIRLVGRESGVTLNAKGRAEAELLASALGSTIRAVYSSPLERTRETATPLAHRAALPLRIEPELNEIDFGEWTNRPFPELASDSRWLRWNTSRASAGAPGGETMGAVQRRIVSALLRLAVLHHDESIVAVSHGDVIKAALAFFRMSCLDDLSAIEFEPGAAALLEIHGSSGVVLGSYSNSELSRLTLQHEVNFAP